MNELKKKIYNRQADFKKGEANVFNAIQSIFGILVDMADEITETIAQSTRSVEHLPIEFTVKMPDDAIETIQRWNDIKKDAGVKEPKINMDCESCSHSGSLKDRPRLCEQCSNHYTSKWSNL